MLISEHCSFLLPNKDRVLTRDPDLASCPWTCAQMNTRECGILVMGVFKNRMCKPLRETNAAPQLARSGLISTVNKAQACAL